MRKVAIFGGSFDPPHLGHLEIIKTALQRLDVDLFFVVPCFLNPFKESFLFTPKSRLKWLETLTKDLEKIIVLDYEIKQNQKTPTYKTLKFIKRTYKLTKNDTIYLLLGADNVESLPQWEAYEFLKKSVEFVIIPRFGFLIPDSFKRLSFRNINISATELRKMLKYGEIDRLKEFVSPLILDEVKEEFCKKIEKK